MEDSRLHKSDVVSLNSYEGIFNNVTAKCERHGKKGKFIVNEKPYDDRNISAHTHTHAQQAEWNY